MANVNGSQTFNWDVNAIALVQGDQYNNDGDTVSVAIYDWETAASHGLNFTATGLPSGLSIDPSSGTISGTLSYGDSATGSYGVTVTATDSDGDISTNTSFNWNVSPLNVSFVELANPTAIFPAIPSASRPFTPPPVTALLWYLLPPDCPPASA